MSEIEDRALERIEVRRGDRPPPAVTIETPGAEAPGHLGTAEPTPAQPGTEAPAAPAEGANAPTMGGANGELRNIPRGPVMQAVGQIGQWLQAAADQLDRVGAEVPGLGRISAKDITLGDVGAVLENMSYGFGPGTATLGGTDPVTGHRDAAAIKLRPEALELLNLSILPGVARAAAAMPRAVTGLAAGAAALTPGEAEGMGSRRAAERIARGIAEEGAGGAGRAASREGANVADRLREAFEAARTAPPKAADQIHLGELTPEVVAKVNQALKDAGSAADVSGYSHQVDAYAARHVFKEHGDAAKEAPRGQRPVGPDDWARIPEIVANPDHVAVVGTTARGQEVIGFWKREPNGMTLYVEEVRKGAKVLAANSMRRFINDGSEGWPGRPHASGGGQQSNVRNAFPGALPIIAVAGEDGNDGE